jgi:hypothetical protein
LLVLFFIVLYMPDPPDLLGRKKTEMSDVHIL